MSTKASRLFPQLLQQNSVQSEGALKSPNDSVQQSTAYTATRSGERSSLDGSSFQTSPSRGLFSSSQAGGGSLYMYYEDHKIRMRADIEQTTRRLELEQRRLYKVDKDLRAAETECDNKRGEYIPNSRDDEVAIMAAKVGEKERALEQAISLLNEETANNEALRDNIDQLRKERQILNSVFKKLERGIANSGKSLNKHLGQINEDKLVNDTSKQRAKALNKMLDRDRRQFLSDTNQIRDELDKQAKICMEQERTQRAVKDPTAKAKGGNRRTYMIADEEEAFSEENMHRRILKLSFLNTIQRRHIKQHQKNIEVFEQAFATIKSTTGISDIEEIVKIFIALEQRNFSLLTYVNQLNREIESIEIRNKDLQNQLNKHKNEESKSAQRRDQALGEARGQLTQMQNATTEKSLLISECSVMLEECRPVIGSIVRYLRREMPRLMMAGYDNDPPILRDPGADEQEDNLNIHLTYIQEAIMQFSLCLHNASQRPVPPLKQSNFRRPPNVDLPSAQLADGDSDDDPETGLSERMFSRAELRDRAQAVIQKRRKGGRTQHQATKHSDVGTSSRTEPTDEGSVMERGDPWGGPPQYGGGAASNAGSGGDQRPRAPGGPPPAKEYAASSVTSRESGADTGQSAVTGQSAASGGAASIKEKEGAPQEEAQPEQKTQDRWWRDKGKK